MIATLRFLLRLPFIVCVALVAPLMFLDAFAMGDSPRKAAGMVRDMLRDVAFGRMS